ncbi:MAG: SDR family NAD(P)-dependent oxidoreductase, partial [Buchnera aphidicola]|nr:SDR family NAD(P)-dependent oxidoreductase [Buchnera aphidicola]
MKIQKYTALVTGASSGIGEEIAKKLSNQGIKVIGTSTNINGVKKINNYLKNKGFGFILDLKDSNSITKKIKNLYNNNYSIDILINNAAIKIDKLFIKMNNQ